MPKTGSRTFTALIRKVSKKRSAKQAALLTPSNSTLRSNSNLLRNFYEESFHKAILIRGHNVFVPRWRSNVLLLNTIRDPIEWMNSLYYYSRYGDQNVVKNKEKEVPSFSDCVLKNLSGCAARPQGYLRYFCGDGPLCRTDEALRISKTNLDSYLIVGLTEEYESFILLVEKFLPNLYRGLNILYRKEVEQLKKSTKTNLKEAPSEKAIKALKKQPGMQMMYEFYEYAKEKFHLLKKCL